MASEQITYADEQAELPNALEDSEIARIMKLVSKSKYKKSEDAPTRQKQEFKPRSLVEIAMEAQKKQSNEDSESKIELEVITSFRWLKITCLWSFKTLSNFNSVFLMSKFLDSTFC